MDRVLVKYNKNNRRVEQIFASAHYNQGQPFITGPNLVRELCR